MKSSRINEMKDALLSRFDSVSKMDAARYLKGLYPDMTLVEFRKAYDEAYW